MDKNEQPEQGELTFADLAERRDIVFSGMGAHALRPSQAAFNRAVKRLRKVKGVLESHRATIEKRTEKFNATVLPVFARFNLALLDWILAAADWHENPRNGLGPVQSCRFLDQILMFVDMIEHNPNGLVEEQIGRLRSRVDELLGADEDGDEDPDGGAAGGSDDPELEFKKSMLRMMEEMLRAEGLDIDLSNLDPDDFDAFNKRAEKALQDAGLAPKPRKRSARQAAAAEERERKKREKEQLKLRDFKSLFKSLAKSMHPDLVTNAEAKEHREQWMKRLTAAYESQDLHGMLAIEMEWLGCESKDLESASDEKLRIYTELLREQIREVEQEIHHLRFQDPFTMFFDTYGIGTDDIPAFVSDLESDVRRTTREAAILQKGGKAAKSLVREILSPRRRYANF